MVHSLLPLTPDTMREFRQEILVDIVALTKSSQLGKWGVALPAHGSHLSFAAAFEALRLFRQITREGFEAYSDSEKTQMAELEVEWCLELLDRLPRSENEPE